MRRALALLLLGSSVWIVGAGVRVALTAPGAGPAPAPAEVPAGAARAIFAGGCFWCMEPPFDAVPGVYATTSGYAGGAVDNPSYAQVSAGSTGHAEVLEVAYDPARVSYAQLLEVFWRNIDPLARNAQFCDRGSQYRSGIYYLDEEQRRLAEDSKRLIEASGRFRQAIATEVAPAGAFYRAEEYHQDFYKKDPIHYKRYRAGCGRDRRLKELWGEGPALPASFTGGVKVSEKKYAKPGEDELRKRLTPIQYAVTQRDGTEPPFRNEYWDNHEAGIYVDVVSGEPLFSSLDKFESGTGWPSFTRPLVPENVKTATDWKIGVPRTEVRSKHGDSHLGHVFDDGPAPTGQRYCMNSAALRFIPADRLEAEGYGEYRALFEKAGAKK